jgi:hypothetical protein
MSRRASPPRGIWPTEGRGICPFRFAGSYSLYGLAQRLQKFLQIFLKNDNLVPLKIRFPMLFAFYDIQKNIPVPVFLDIEEVCPPFRF